MSKLLSFKYTLTLLMFCGLAAHAQILHIDSVGCEVNETDTSYLNKMVRHEGQFYNQIFNTHLNDTASIRISIYGKNKAYVKAVKATGLKDLTNGMYSAEQNRTFVFKNEAFMHVILRSVSNNLWRYNYPNAPKWLTEGSATVMSFIDEDENRKLIYTPNFDYNKQIKDLTWGDGIDFDALFMDNNTDWNSKASTNGKVLHAVSFCVFYFLVIQDKDYLTPIVASLKQGHTADEAFASAFGSFGVFKDKFTFYYRYLVKSRFSSASM
ncbi:MAG: hypothetical protein ABIN91_21205 [Mucilaginibacter sp.]|uniref:hypothetical protein n=1 Tax=Mucilaginibacter sp. TaxID=1882438 RepID=UPI003266E5AE